MSRAQIAFNAVAAIAIVVIGFLAVRPAGDQKFGSSFYESYPIQFGGGLQIGQGGNVLAKAISGTCNPSIASLPIAATSTAIATCTVPAAAIGDKVFVTLPAGSAATYNGFTIHAAYANAGSIGIVLENLTGAATSSFPLATTSVQYWVVR